MSSDYLVSYQPPHKMAAIVLAIIIGLFSYIYYHLSQNNNYWKKRNIPGPEPSFLYGNIKDVMQKKSHIGLITKKIYDSYPNEKVVGILVLRSPELMVRDLDILKHILIKDFDVFVDRGSEFSETGLGANLFHADGDTWRVLRNRFTPLFTSGKLKNMMYLITERGDIFVNYVDQITQKDPEIEVHGLVQKFTQATIAACAFGLDIDTFNQEHEQLRIIDQKIFTLNLGRIIDMMYPGLLKTVGGTIFPKGVHSFFMNLVKDVIAKRNGVPTNRNDFMDLLLALRESKQISGPKKDSGDMERTLEITDEIMAGQAFVFYAAGYETSASTMGFLLYQLALNPQIQDKVVEEIKDVLNRHNGELTLQALLDLKYLGQVFDETLRMYPIVTDLKRKSSREYKMPGTNITIEKNQIIKIPVMGIHWDKTIYPNPEVFDPERFSPENVAARHQCAYLPFGLGPRQCIGVRFAQVQSRVCLVKLLSKFRVEPSKNTPVTFEFEPRRVMLYPRQGFPVNIIKRN